MEKFNKYDIVINTLKEKSVVVIVSNTIGQSEGEFEGTVIHSDWNYFKVGHHSSGWNESKFSNAPKGLEFKIIS